MSRRDAIQAAATARITGQGAKAGEVVTLAAKGTMFRTVADKEGKYAFRAKAIPPGTPMVTAGSGIRQMVEIATA